MGEFDLLKIVSFYYSRRAPESSFLPLGHEGRATALAATRT